MATVQLVGLADWQQLVLADYWRQLWILIVLRFLYSSHPCSTSTHPLQGLGSPLLPAPALAMGPWCHMLVIC